ncbi:unnamed protein product [Lathyrus sativus]|nr:unnamed protein product [Lathyrus sativus]
MLSTQPSSSESRKSFRFHRWGSHDSLNLVLAQVRYVGITSWWCGLKIVRCVLIWLGYSRALWLVMSWLLAIDGGCYISFFLAWQYYLFLIHFCKFMNQMG